MHFSNVLVALVTSLALNVQAAPTTSANPAVETRDALDKRNFGNCNGCGLCQASGQFYQDCRGAVSQFQDNTVYQWHQRMTSGRCYADWHCQNGYPYKYGKDIKNVFTVGIWQKANNGNCKSCGEWWLEDGSGCHATVQAVGC